LAALIWKTIRKKNVRLFPEVVRVSRKWFAGVMKEVGTFAVDLLGISENFTAEASLFCIRLMCNFSIHTFFARIIPQYVVAAF
jgi:hypothetical protein